jgi:predicted nicotinamide N-methyase
MSCSDKAQQALVEEYDDATLDALADMQFVMERYLPQRIHTVRVGADSSDAFDVALHVADGDHGICQSGYCPNCIRTYINDILNLCVFCSMFLWRGANILCDYLALHWSAISSAALQSANDRDSVRVLELGAGVGLVSVALAKLIRNRDSLTSDRKYHIVATDRDENALNLIRQNFEHNATTSTSSSCIVETECVSLDWGHDGQSTLTALHCPERGVDFLVGSDLLYAPEAMRLLFWTVAHSLARAFIGLIVLYCLFLEKLILKFSTGNSFARFYLCTSLRLAKDSSTIELIDAECKRFGLQRVTLRDDVLEGGVMIEVYSWL